MGICVHLGCLVVGYPVGLALSSLVLGLRFDLLVCDLRWINVVLGVVGVVFV